MFSSRSDVANSLMQNRDETKRGERPSQGLRRDPGEYMAQKRPGKRVPSNLFSILGLAAHILK